MTEKKEKDTEQEEYLMRRRVRNTHKWFMKHIIIPSKKEYSNAK